MWYPYSVSTTLDTSTGLVKLKATEANSGTKSVRLTKPSSPPLVAEPGSSEYKIAKV